MTTLTLADPFHCFTWPRIAERRFSVPAESLERTIDESLTVVSAPEELDTTSHTSAIDVSSAYFGGILDAFQEVMDELERYEEYPVGWDGYTGECFSSHTVRRMRKLACLIAADLLAERVLPDLFTSGPASDGSLDLELRIGRRRVFFTLYPGDQKPEVAAFEEGKPADVRPSREDSVERWVEWLAS